MLKRIFVPLENSAYSFSALEYACFIAKRQDAEVTGGIFLDIDNINTPLGKLNSENKIVWSGKIDNKIITQAKTTIEYLKHKFIDKCSKKGIQFTTEKEVGMPSSNINILSKYYDLLITGLKSDFKLNKKPLTSEYLEKMLDSRVTPVLAVPRHFKKIKNVVIIYDASVSAARALQRFAHIANFKDHKINIVMSSDDESIAEDNLSRAKDFLLSYGAPNVITDWTHADIFKLLESFYFEVADLLVLGLHSKRSIKDFFVGSVTKYLINNTSAPLFIGI